MTSDELGAREQNLSAAVRRVARAALEMEDATAALRASQAEYNQAVRERMAQIAAEKEAGRG